ncbi:MAG TPA: tryptophan synthase subunit beta [candidate division Zixibacteria bacterium]|nr:tryptophan synthase subunit beta [candidate division Zixibacteria bacterium]
MSRTREKRTPDARGRYGPYGGRFVPETVIFALEELERGFREARRDPSFRAELKALLRDYVGRPSPLYFARRFSERVGAQVYLKREDLNHTGAHKINNSLGQALLAVRMNKRRIIAETGAGQHGLATATACALFGLKCVIYMGSRDIERQAPNVRKMKLLGATVVPVTSGAQTLKDATNEALRDWVTNVRDTFYIIGSAVGPHPYPWLVREFQKVIGVEARSQFKRRTGALPDVALACVGGGSNAIGLFQAFLRDEKVELIGVEAGGYGLRSGKHSASLRAGTPGVLHGSYSYLLSDRDGQVLLPHSISAGLDYPGVGPEHAYLRDSGRVGYHAVTDRQALEALRVLAQCEGIIPALESAHALAFLMYGKRFKATRGKGLRSKPSALVCLSGRGDKDMAVVESELGITE